MKILIINIDHHHRSVYTGLVAASLRQKIPTARITALLSSPNDFLDTTGVFEKIKFIDPGSFFHKTKDLPSHEIESEMKNLLGELTETEWGVVINLSSNLLGSLLANFLKSKEGKGAFLSADFAGLKQSDIFSHALSELSDKYGHHLHFSYLYRNMLRRFEDIQLTSSWPKIVEQEFSKYFEDLLKEEGKKKIVIVDADLADTGLSSEKDFLLSLFKRLKRSADYLPILVGTKIAADTPVIKYFQEKLDGKVTTLQLQNKAKLSVLGLGALVVTGDVYLKSVADLKGVRSVFITNILDTEDFSIVEGSLQIVLPRLSSEAGDEVASLAESMLAMKELNPALKEGEVYISLMENNIPYISPLGQRASSEYAQWLLGLRFFAKLLRTEISRPAIDKPIYIRAIAREKEIFQSKREEGIFGVARDIAAANLKNTPLQSMAHVNEVVTSFLNSEEGL